MSLENFGRNAGGEVGDMLKAQERQANADIWGKLNDALPTATDAAAAERAVDNLSQQRLKDMKLGAPLDAGGATGSLLDEMIRKSVGKVRDALESARGSFDDAVTISNADGTPEAVHSWRKGINDSINAARARGESGLASELDNKLRDIKTALDRELGARVTHPGAQPGADVWNPFLRDFYAAKTKARQAGAGVDLRTKCESRARDSAGTPLPSSMAGDLRTLQAKAKNNQLVDRFDNPLLADDVQRALNVAERDVWLQGLSRVSRRRRSWPGTANYLRGRVRRSSSRRRRRSRRLVGEVGRRGSRRAGNGGRGLLARAGEELDGGEPERDQSAGREEPDADADGSTAGWGGAGAGVEGWRQSEVRGERQEGAAGCGQ
ncbi:MAG: hypothetical protein IPN24_18475 [Betaproteobacteria bacterium]|nr:hypothetical protein [Betaproteobacteria bacterium]